MPLKKDATITHQPRRSSRFLQENNDQLPPTTPRRSPRFLSHNPTTPIASKLKDSSKKPSNQRKPIESCSRNTRGCTTLLRRSPRFVEGEVSTATYQNDGKESRNDKPSVSEAKVEKKHVVCGIASVEVSDVRKNEGGEKAKRKKRKRGKETAEGWAKEQELALQRAFFSVKPSPHFWKNVSKMVPGKSQQDCFDRIHGDHMTPPQLPPRSRARTVKSSPIQQFSISASELLKPTDKKVRRPNILKPKNCITQKSVEKLLQHRLQVDQGRRGDIFSILEPNIDFSSNASQPSAALSTPTKQKENQVLLQSCTETSSSSHKKKQSLSRFSGSHVTNLVSPPVLKQVKNKGMHEKYINQLRRREARRIANSARLQIPVPGKIIHKGDVVKAAKVALASEARDAINKFQQSQVNFMDNTFCSDEENIDDNV
ncbi:uncharacterized protein LOC107487056 [Arachis duranensis]|uniref:Uncharacterized protein LOC107487056 n=1 Tax=Arachis duranensis TaxID=130453 RepID=A0A6P4D8N2_ARADU|nr:uncharacterized protein LOC107487056 [Arachis duranensis]